MKKVFTVAIIGFGKRSVYGDLRNIALKSSKSFRFAISIPFSK
ncbi:MAG: hypothetical protein ACLUSP_05180 [Christensenellales bacterium]